MVKVFCVYNDSSKMFRSCSLDVIAYDIKDIRNEFRRINPYASDAFVYWTFPNGHIFRAEI